MKFFDELYEQTGFQFDRSVNIYYLIRDGYHFGMSFNGSQYYLMSAVASEKGFPDLKALKDHFKPIRPIKSVMTQGYRVIYVIRPSLKQTKLIENIREALDQILEYYRNNGYHNCCEVCGKVCDSGLYMVGGQARFLCDEDYLDLSQRILQRNEEISQMQGSLLAGLVGAFLGSLIGVVAIILFGQIGFVSALSGVIMGVCAIRGYEILGKKVSILGLILTCLIMLGMCYLANRIDWSITVARALDWNFFDAFRLCEEVCRWSEVIDSYFASLAQVVLFTLVGAAPSIANAIKGTKNLTITSVINKADKGEEE